MNTSADTVTNEIERASDTLQSKSKLAIERRLVRFDFDSLNKADFFSNNPVISAFWAGLSATFPLGEAEFINSVKLYEDQVSDPKLKADVRDFAAQEAHHSLQHKKINQQFSQQGFNIEQIESVLQDIHVDRVNNWSNKKRIMRTVAAEHVTAVMAHYALTHPQVFDDAPASFRDLFLWHAIEEIEHKSVAFDVYQSCVADMPSLKRHYVAFVFVEFPIKMTKITRFLLKDRGHRSTWRERREMWRFLFGKSGMISSVVHLFFKFLKKGFHPWDHDDSELVARWKEKLAPRFINQ